MTYPKKGYQLIIETNASDNGIGAVLKQVNPELAYYKTKEARAKGAKYEPTKSEEEIIEFGSKSLSLTQRKWESTMKEIYAIYYYLLNWKPYIGNRSVIVWTDNTGISDASGKMVRNDTMQK